MTHAEFCDSLRKLAAWYEQHEEVPLPDPRFSIYSWECDKRETLAKIVRALRHVTKEQAGVFGELLAVMGTVGGITLRFLASRQAVCTLKQVGTKTVTRETPTSFEEVTETVKRPTKFKSSFEEVPVMEWECPSLLKQVAD